MRTHYSVLYCNPSLVGNSIYTFVLDIDVQNVCLAMELNGGRVMFALLDFLCPREREQSKESDTIRIHRAEKITTFKVHSTVTKLLLETNLCQRVQITQLYKKLFVLFHVARQGSACSNNGDFIS